MSHDWHQHSAIDPRAKIADSVEIGPFCSIGPDVTIAAGTRLLGNVTIMGKVTIGRYNCIHPGCVIGGEPQDVSYRGDPTSVEIGDHNVFREGVTINRGTVKDARVTRIGSHCYFMACSHAAHDCQIGDHVILANAVLLGGHVHVHDFAVLSGGAAVHHYTTVGKYAFVGGLSRVIQDVPPFMLAEGSPARPRYINLVALKRNDFPADIIAAISEAYRLLYRANEGLDQTREKLREHGKLLPQVNELLHFIQSQHEGRNGRARQLRRAA